MRITSTASSSISSRSHASGQRAPVTCSFRFSPVPTPRKKRPGIIAAHVAVACATIAGWMRISGHVTPVPRRNRSVTCAIPPMTLHTNGLWPWLSCHGWKWSEIRPNVKPASSASRACCTRSFGRCSSDENAYPSSGMGCDVPRPLLHKLAVRAHRRAMRIVGLGGGGSTPVQVRKLQRYVLGTVSKQRPKERPRICYVPTAVGDATEFIARFYENYAGLGELSHLKFFPYPPDDLRELVLGQDVLVVSGGNTANLLAIWRVHGFDAIVREAWEQGVVLTGGSAGMICWYEASVTDSFGPQLEGLRNVLGFLAGSACPHYDGEELRRPRYR